MILAINLREDEIDNFDLYKAIQYIWLNADSVTQYDDMDVFKKNIKEHITDFSGNNFIGVVDTEHKHFEIANVNANISITGIEGDK